MPYIYFLKAFIKKGSRTALLVLLIHIPFSNSLLVFNSQIWTLIKKKKKEKEDMGI